MLLSLSLWWLLPWSKNGACFLICLIQLSPEIIGRLLLALDWTAIKHDDGTKGSIAKEPTQKEYELPRAEEQFVQAWFSLEPTTWSYLSDRWCRSAQTLCPRLTGARRLALGGSFRSAPPSSLCSHRRPPPWRWESPPGNLALLCLSGRIQQTQRPLRSLLASSESTLSFPCSHAYP